VPREARAAEGLARWRRPVLIALVSVVVLFAVWLWLDHPSSTTAVGYAPLPAAPAITRLTVSPSAPRRHERVTVSFISRRATGVFGKQRRSYWIQAKSVQPASACVNNRDRGLPSGPAGYRLRATLDPARGDGGELGWCPGRFKGTVTYLVGRRSSIAARFSFVVR
jgi:hypothetical protein